MEEQLRLLELQERGRQAVCAEQSARRFRRFFQQGDRAVQLACARAQHRKVAQTGVGASLLVRRPRRLLAVAAAVARGVAAPQPSQQQAPTPIFGGMGAAAAAASPVGGLFGAAPAAPPSPVPFSGFASAGNEARLPIGGTARLVTKGQRTSYDVLRRRIIGCANWLMSLTSSTLSAGPPSCDSCCAWPPCAPACAPFWPPSCAPCRLAWKLCAGSAPGWPAPPPRC